MIFRKKKKILCGVAFVIFSSWCLIFHDFPRKARTDVHSADARTFTKGKVNKLIIAGYMRGGTTFLGELFQRNPNALYFYETLGAFYSYYYGLTTHPIHGVWWNEDRTVRIRNQEEKENVADFLDKLLNCRFDKLPIGIVTHPNIFYLSADTISFGRCLKSKSGLNMWKYEDCVPITQGQCSGGFVDRSMAADCVRSVHNAYNQMHFMNDSSMSSPEMKPFIEREKCFMKMQNAHTECSQEFRQKCEARTLRAIKTHRFSLQNVQVMLNHVPDMKILYYVRDPRGIHMSRGWDERAAKALCTQMEMDYDMYGQLSVEYPDSILKVRYDDLAQNTDHVTSQIYRFLGLDVPSEVTQFLKKITKAEADNGAAGTRRANSTATSIGWRSKIKDADLQMMNSYCKDIIARLGYEL